MTDLSFGSITMGFMRIRGESLNLNWGELSIQVTHVLVFTETYFKFNINKLFK